MSKLFQLLNVLFVAVLAFEGCNLKNGNKNYLVFVLVDTNAILKDNAKVILNGKEVGQLDTIDSLSGNRQLLGLKIYYATKIPAASKVNYLENILNDAYISITYSGSGSNGPFLAPYDTVNLHSFQCLKRMDSSSMKRIVEKVNEVKEVVDSTLKKQ